MLAINSKGLIRAAALSLHQLTQLLNISVKNLDPITQKDENICDNPSTY